MASQSKFGKSFESSNLVFLPIAKGNYVINGFKMESKFSLSPTNARRRCFKVWQACIEGSIKKIINNNKESNE
jgi:hypothetical protein